MRKAVRCVSGWWRATGLLCLLACRPGWCDRVFVDGFDPAELAAIAGRSGEFANAATLDDWQRLWQVEHWPWPSNTTLPRAAAAGSKLPAGGVGAASDSW